jgi:hypothetical protein
MKTVNEKELILWRTLVLALIGICIICIAVVISYNKPTIKCEKEYSARCVLIAVPAKLVTAK